MNDTFYVYALMVPGGHRYHYIGITRLPRSRERQHQNGSWTGRAVTMWLRSLLDRGIKPQMKILFRADRLTAHAIEHKLMVEGLKLGWPLKNGVVPSKDGPDAVFHRHRKKSYPAKGHYRMINEYRRGKNKK